MIEVFDIGMKILLSGTFVFFLVFFFLCVNWAKHTHPERHIKIGFLVSMLYTFLFFLTGLLLLALINFFYKYFFPLPGIWKSPL